MCALPAVTRLTDDEFDRLIGEGDPRVRGRVELRRGALCRMNSEYIPHGRMAVRIYDALKNAVGASDPPLEVLMGVTVRFGGGFSPMPDVLIWTPTKAAGTVPGADVMLVVEVADTTRADDLGDKRREYATAGLSEYWVADIQRRVMHRFSAPVGGDYSRSAEVGNGEQIVSDTLPGIAVTVLFP